MPHHNRFAAIVALALAVGSFAGCTSEGKPMSAENGPPPKKMAVFTLVEREGRARSRHVADVTAKTLRPAIVRGDGVDQLDLERLALPLPTDRPQVEIPSATWSWPVRDERDNLVPSTIGAEWEQNPFIRVWRELDSESAEPVSIGAPDSEVREPATLVLWAPDYDGGNKAWVRFEGGADAIVGGSQVKREA